MTATQDECRIILKESEIISSKLLEVELVLKECREIEILRKIVQDYSEVIPLLHTMTST